jgi:hypothetical protein
MKHIKTFESFSHVNEELSFSDIKSWFAKNSEAVRKFVADLSASSNPKVKELLGKVDQLKPEDKAKAVEGTEEVVAEAPAENVQENFLKGLGGGMKWLGKIAQWGAGGGLVYSLSQAVLADEGIIDKVKAYHPAGMPIGIFIACCCAALVGGLIVSKVGQAMAKK